MLNVRAEILIGPITRQEACQASWYSNVNPALDYGLVATRSELVAGLVATHDIVNRERGVPCTPPADDDERRARDAARVRTAGIIGFLAKLGALAQETQS